MKKGVFEEFVKSDRKTSKIIKKMFPHPVRKPNEKVLARGWAILNNHNKVRIDGVTFEVYRKNFKPIPMDKRKVVRVKVVEE
jgi:hypothetical protein